MAQPAAQFFGLFGQLRQVFTQVLRPLLNRLGRTQGLAGALVQFLGAVVQFLQTLAQTRDTLFGARGIHQHQRPAFGIQAFVDFVAQLGRKLLRDARRLEVVALRGKDHQLPCAHLLTGHGVGTEVFGNDQGKRQLTLLHFRASGRLIADQLVVKSGLGFQHVAQLLSHVDLLIAVDQTVVKIDQAHLELGAVRGRIPNAGQINQAVQAGNQRHDGDRPQQLRTAQEKTGFYASNRA